MISNFWLSLKFFSSIYFDIRKNFSDIRIFFFVFFLLPANTDAAFSVFFCSVHSISIALEMSNKHYTKYTHKKREQVSQRYNNKQTNQAKCNKERKKHISKIEKQWEGEESRDRGREKNTTWNNISCLEKTLPLKKCFTLVVRRFAVKIQ